jgi:hypothetical protein
MLPFHPLAGMFPLMEREEFDALVADIGANGQQEPIILYKAEVIDGRNRALACEQLRIEPDYDVLDIPLDVEDVEAFLRAFILSANLHRRHLTAEQKREVIAALLKADPTQSDRTIAKEAKTHHHAVAKVRQEEEGRGNISHVEKRTDAIGRQQPATRPRTALDEERSRAVKRAFANADPELIVLRDLTRFLFLNIDSGTLVLTGDPDALRRWKDLRARYVEAAISS